MKYKVKFLLLQQKQKIFLQNLHKYCFDSIFFLVYNIDCKIIRNGTDYMQEITNDVIERAKKALRRILSIFFARFKGSVASCAAKLRTEFFDFDDAVQEGNIGLF